MTLSLRSLAVVTTTAVLLAAAAPAQQLQTRTLTLDSDSAVILPELGAVLEMKNDTLSVLAVAPSEARAAEYRGVDLQEGDRVIMADGKRVTTAAAMRALLDSAAMGDTVRLALRRDKKLIMVTFVKADPAKQPGRLMMVQGAPGTDTSGQATVTMGGPGASLTMLVGAFVVGPEGDGVSVKANLPNAAAPVSGEPLQAGDHIVSLNDRPVTGLESVRTLSESLREGDTVRVVFERAGTRHTAQYRQGHPAGGATYIRKKP